MDSTEELVRRLSRQGLRITGQRRALVRLFDETDGYLTPKEIYDHMTGLYPGLSFDTVYRNLRVLLELGIVEQVMFEEGVKFRRHCGGEHHHHMICLQCEKTVPIRTCPMAAADVPDDFRVVRHKFEVFGYCAECQAAGLAGDGE